MDTGGDTMTIIDINAKMKRPISRPVDMELVEIEHNGYDCKFLANHERNIYGTLNKDLEFEVLYTTYDRNNIPDDLMYDYLVKVETPNQHWYVVPVLIRINTRDETKEELCTMLGTIVSLVFEYMEGISVENVYISG